MKERLNALELVKRAMPDKPSITRLYQLSTQNGEAALTFAKAAYIEATGKTEVESGFFDHLLQTGTALVDRAEASVSDRETTIRAQIAALRTKLVSQEEKDRFDQIKGTLHRRLNLSRRGLTHHLIRTGELAPEMISQDGVIGIPSGKCAYKLIFVHGYQLKKETASRIKTQALTQTTNVNTAPLDPVNSTPAESVRSTQEVDTRVERKVNKPIFISPAASRKEQLIPEEAHEELNGLLQKIRTTRGILGRLMQRPILTEHLFNAIIRISNETASDAIFITGYRNSHEKDRYTWRDLAQILREHPDWTIDQLVYHVRNYFLLSQATTTNFAPVEKREERGRSNKIGKIIIPPTVRYSLT